jgi:hypothetical protein
MRTYEPRADTGGSPMAALLLMLAVLLVSLCAPRLTLATDFPAEFDRLDKKIGNELSEPRPSPRNDVGPYVHWLQVKAADRDRAMALALEAGDQNPYFQRLFGDLAEDAQMSGDYTVDLAARMLLQFDATYDQYWLICYRVERYGKALWEATIANKFDREIIRDRVRNQMRYSINNLENRWLWCCEEGKSVAEKEGHLIQGDFENIYLPRSAFVKGSKTALDICPYVDEWLAEVEKCVRKPCEFFGLIGIRDVEATPMMEEYLEDTLCLKQDLGHKHYLELAKQYQLRKAQEYIEGFYAKLKGTVWIEEAEGRRKPAKGAMVTVVDPRDGTTWKATADAEGKYEIEKGLLHNHKGKDDENRCPKFEISAELGGDRVDDTYEGPLREPDRNAEHVKDLVIQRDRWLVTVTYTEEMTYAGGSGPDVGPWKGSRSFTQTLKAELNRTRKGEPASNGRRFYEATTANLELEDHFQQVTQVESGGKAVASWHGEKHGPVGALVRLQFNDRQKHCYLDSKDVTGDPPVWKTTFQWSGFPPIPDGACEMSDTTTDGVFNIGTAWLTDSGEPLAFEEGQEVLRGERRWSEIGSESAFRPSGQDYASANCSSWGSPLPGFAEQFFTLETGAFAENSKTIKWEIRRLGTPR